MSSFDWNLLDELPSMFTGTPGNAGISNVTDGTGIWLTALCAIRTTQSARTTLSTTRSLVPNDATNCAYLSLNRNGWVTVCRKAEDHKATFGDETQEVLNNLCIASNARYVPTDDGGVKISYDLNC